MDIKRHIIVKAIKTEENELIPLWDSRLTFEQSDDYGDYFKMKGSWDKYFSLTDCIYDLKTKKIEIGIELDNYPLEKDLEFKKGQTVLFEKSHKVLAQATISDIIYEEFDLSINRGRKLEPYWVEKFKDVKIDPNMMYAIKQWKPFYLLDNGIKIEWSHMLYHVYDASLK